MLDPGCAVLLGAYVDHPMRASQQEYHFHLVTVGPLNTTGCYDVFALPGAQQALDYLFPSSALQPQFASSTKSVSPNSVACMGPCC